MEDSPLPTNKQSEEHLSQDLFRDMESPPVYQGSRSIFQILGPGSNTLNDVSVASKAERAGWTIQDHPADIVHSIAKTPGHELPGRAALSSGPSSR